MTEAVETNELTLNVEQVVKDILSTIDREREREIIARRYGLYDRKETLEQIGELLGITRERVRQLEKAVMTKLKSVAEKELPHIADVEKTLSAHIKQMGNVARISDITDKVVKDANKIDRSRVAFLSQLAPNLTHVGENDHFHNAVSLKEIHTEKSIRDGVGHVIEAIKNIGKPAKIEEIAGAMGHPDAKAVAALASVSKNLATLNGRWGLMKWPTVNPKNIRDKIYVILHENGKQMHFGEIAEAIRESDFKRKDVTTQAIHNELIKDKRFILVGRGIYALKEWGFKQGTVADVITEVLKDADEPLHRDEIVKRVLKKRFVKETTILLNLPGKPKFKRTAKATYTLAQNTQQTMAIDGVESFIENFLHPSVSERIVADIAQNDANSNSRQQVLERLGYSGKQIAGSNYNRFGLLKRLGVLTEWPATEDVPRLTYSIDPEVAETLADYYELKIDAMRRIADALRNISDDK